MDFKSTFRGLLGNRKRQRNAAEAGEQGPARENFPDFDRTYVEIPFPASQQSKKHRYVFKRAVIYKGRTYKAGDTIDLTQQEIDANPQPHIWEYIGDPESLDSGKTKINEHLTLLDHPFTPKEKFDEVIKTNRASDPARIARDAMALRSEFSSHGVPIAMPEAVDHVMRVIEGKPLNAKQLGNLAAVEQSKYRASGVNLSLPDALSQVMEKLGQTEIPEVPLIPPLPSLAV